MAIGIFSKGILKTVPYLEVFLQDKVILNPKSPEGLKAIAGWGYKPTAKKAIKKAKEWGLPYLALEDGFIRSIGLGFEEPPLSLIVDPVGIYYDASRPSLLENILNEGDFNKELLEDVKKLMEYIKKYEISKYNNFKTIPEELKGKLQGKENILVVDQTYGDMSVVLGCATEEDFKYMLESAIDENPNAQIIVKIHPDVIKGKKKGYLQKFIKKYKGLIVISENFSPIGLLKLVDKVYTVSSQLGFEALILGKEVHCFGIPFYSNWGLTKDRKQIGRRKRKLRVEELVAGALILYPRYKNPYFNRLDSIHTIIKYLIKKKIISMVF